MESNTQSPFNDNNVDAKATATFRKPVNDSGSRKYRRRSAVDGSSSSEGSPIRKRKSSPPVTRKDHEKTTDELRRKDVGRDLDRDSGRGGQYGRGGGDSSRYSETHPSRSSRGDYHRRDDHRRRDRYANDGDRDYSRSSRDSEFSRKENEYRPRHYERDSSKYSRDNSTDKYGDRTRGRDSEKESLSRELRKPEQKDLSSDKAGRGHKSSASEDDVEEGEMYEDKKDTEERLAQQRSSSNYKPDYSPSYEQSKTHKYELNSTKDRSGYRPKETSRNDGDCTKLEKRSSDQKDKFNERYDKKSEGQFYDRKKHFSKDQESSAKKPKVSGSDGSTEGGTDVNKVKSAQEPNDEGTFDQTGVTNSDIDAAKLAAMKAAESVNRNLIGTGYMSADQKKKLLWGSKKTAVTEESGNRWDTTTFGDPERQEKFHKLMSLRLHWYLLPNVGCEGRNESRNEKNGRAAGREAEGATPIGFREAIHCWSSSQRRSNRWIRSLNFIISKSFFFFFCVCVCM